MRKMAKGVALNVGPITIELDRNVAAGLVHDTVGLVEPDADVRPQSQDELGEQAALRLRERVRSRVMPVSSLAGLIWSAICRRASAPVLNPSRTARASPSDPGTSPKAIACRAAVKAVCCAVTYSRRWA